MTLIEARNYLNQQIELSSGYSRNAIRMLLSEVLRTHGETATQELIEAFELQQRFEITLEGVMRF